MKKALSLILALRMLFAVSAMPFAEETLSVSFPVYEDTEFGGVNIDVSQEAFALLGICLGDSVDIQISNGFTLEDIPYYDGYYGRTNHPVLVNYPGLYIQVAFCTGDPMWNVAGCAEGDTITITVREKGKYLNQQNAMASVYTDDRAAFASDEIFANFRPMTGGKLKADMFYRGASPVNNVHLRAGTVNALLEKNRIAYILDLADTREKLAEYMASGDFGSDYAASLFEKGCGSLLGLSASYRSDGFKAALADGLRDMTGHEGPYYIHCTEGKDRTGFVCMLLEALAGASYEEIEYDYMKTYGNYYGITESSDPAKYDSLAELRLYDMLWWLLDAPDGTALEALDFTEAAENYLLSAGMTEGEIAALSNILTE